MHRISYILAVVCILCFGCGNINKDLIDNIVSVEGDTRSFQQVVEFCRTPQELSDWMKINLTYREDKSWEEFKSPERTFNDGYGDCDDFALFSKFVLEYHGISTNIISIWGDNYGHAIVLCHYGYFSNTTFFPGTYTIRDVCNICNKDWTGWSVYPEDIFIPRKRGE